MKVSFPLWLLSMVSYVCDQLTDEEVIVFIWSFSFLMMKWNSATVGRVQLLLSCGKEFVCVHFTMICHLKFDQIRKVRRNK